MCRRPVLPTGMFYSKKKKSFLPLFRHRHFPVVGVLEMMEETLAVLEHYLPQFFSGLSEVKGAVKLLQHVKSQAKTGRVFFFGHIEFTWKENSTLAITAAICATCGHLPIFCHIVEIL